MSETKAVTTDVAAIVAAAVKARENTARPVKRARQAFDRDALKRICEMHETEFAAAYGLKVTQDDDLYKGEEYADFHAFKDNGSNILAVAHLDTVIDHKRRTTRFVQTEDGEVVHSGALDDRLGAYTILELLPLLGISVDVLLTTGEESGRSTAQYFHPPAGKQYHWMIEFDRGGTDVVMYQYDDKETRELVKECGARPADGIFSDISYMEHLEIKGFNWGVGYHDYHGPRGYAYINDYLMMIGHFVRFHEANENTYLPHEEDRFSGYGRGRWGGSGRSGLFDDDEVECPLECGDILWGGTCYTCEDSDPFATAEKRADEEFDDTIDGEIVDGDSVIDNPTQEDHDALDDAISGYYRKRMKAPLAIEGPKITADTSMFSDKQTKRLLDAGHSEHVG